MPSPSLFQTGEMSKGPTLVRGLLTFYLFGPERQGLRMLPQRRQTTCGSQPWSRGHFNDYRRDDRHAFATSRAITLPTPE